MIALLLVSACAPPGEGPPRNWRGDDVRAYKTDLPELDSATAVVCTPPTDDDLILRLMQTYGGFTADRNPDASTPFTVSLGVDGITPVNAYGQSSTTLLPIWGAYDVGFHITYNDVVADTDRTIHRELVYDWGLRWPLPPWIYNFGTQATFKGPIAKAGTGSYVKVARSRFWYDFDDLSPFYPFRACLARFRPDRFQGTFWFDAMDTRHADDGLPGPLYLVWDMTQSYGYRMDWVEYNFTNTYPSDEYGTRGVHAFSAHYYDDLTEAEVFPHLIDED